MHPLLRDINDMGEFRSEHRGNFTYWLGVASSRWCGLCSCFGVVVLVYMLLYDVPLYNKAEPKNFLPMLLLVIVCWGFVISYVSFAIYAVRRNRKNPLLYALYEKGLLVVHRNRTIHRVFWDDIDEIRQLEMKPLFGLGKPVFQGIALHFRPDGLRTVVRPICIRVEFFQNAKQLCHAICEAKGQNDQM